MPWTGLGVSLPAHPRKSKCKRNIYDAAEGGARLLFQKIEEAACLEFFPGCDTMRWVYNHELLPNKDYTAEPHGRPRNATTRVVNAIITPTWWHQRNLNDNSGPRR